MVFVKSNEPELEEEACKGVKMSTEEGLLEAQQLYERALVTLQSAEKAQIGATASKLAAADVAKAKASVERSGVRLGLIRNAIAYTKPEARRMVGRVFVTLY
jgi:hypothetical protein